MHEAVQGNPSNQYYQGNNHQQQPRENHAKTPFSSSREGEDEGELMGWGSVGGTHCSSGKGPYFNDIFLALPNRLLELRQVSSGPQRSRHEAAASAVRRGVQIRLCKVSNKPGKGVSGNLSAMNDPLSNG